MKTHSCPFQLSLWTFKEAAGKLAHPHTFSSQEPGDKAIQVITDRGKPGYCSPADQARDDLSDMA